MFFIISLLHCSSKIPANKANLIETELSRERGENGSERENEGQKRQREGDCEEEREVSNEEFGDKKEGRGESIETGWRWVR